MCISVIRDRVANMTIMDILRYRNKIKAEIQKTLQDTLSGWGMKIDTVEISNVRIKSHDLFKNMQTEFREQKNLIAEQIRSETENQIRNDKLSRDQKYNIEYRQLDTQTQKKQLEMQAEVRALEKEQQIKKQSLVQQENQERFTTDQETQSRSGDIKVMREEVSNRLEKKNLMQEQRLLTDSIIENRMIDYVSHVLTKSNTGWT